MQRQSTSFTFLGNNFWYQVRADRTHYLKIQVEKELLSLKEDELNKQDNNGRSILYRAAEAGHENIVRQLLAKKDIIINFGNTIQSSQPLYAAIDNNHTEIALLLLNAGADPKVKSQLGKTYLHIAAQNNNPKLIEILVARGLNINEKYDGNSPLTLAAYYRKTKAALSLIKLGTNVNLPLKSDEYADSTPLFLAVLAQDLQLVEALLSANANVNFPCKGFYEGMTPLHLASTRDATLIQLLIQAGADKNARLASDNRDQTPLMLAVTYGIEKEVEVLLRAGVDINAAMNKGEYKGATALHLAAKCPTDSASEKVQLLIDHGADVNLVDAEGKTALHWLLIHHHTNEAALKVARILLENDINVNAQILAGEWKGLTALDLADTLGGFFHFLEILLKFEARRSVELSRPLKLK